MSSAEGIQYGHWPHHFTFKVGDRVQVINQNKIYHWYTYWLKYYHLKYTLSERHHRHHNERGVILHIGSHLDEPEKMLVLVQMDLGDTILINANGLRLERYKKTKYKLGDQVAVTDQRHCYDAYHTWPGLKGRTLLKGDIRGCVGKVVEIGPHENTAYCKDIVLIETSDRKYILMDEAGLSPAKKIDTVDDYPQGAIRSVYDVLMKGKRVLWTAKKDTFHQKTEFTGTVQNIDGTMKIEVVAGTISMMVPAWEYALDEITLEHRGWFLFENEKDAEEFTGKKICECCGRPL